MTNDERTSVYNASGQIVPNAIEKTIVKICNDPIAEEYIRNSNISGSLLYECSNILFYGTQCKC